MKRIIALVLIAALILPILSGCGAFSAGGGDAKEPTIAYLDHYACNNLTPTDSYMYEARPYKNADSKPIIMGGNYYHGGFTLGHTVGPYTPGYAVFDVSAYTGKALAFVLGSVTYQLNDDDRYAIVSVYADDKQVIDALVKANEAPKRYILDLTGVTELSFKILEGYCELGVAELTVWDGTAVTTGPTIDDTTQKLRLIKDIHPFFFDLDTVIHSDRVVSAEEKTATYDGSEALALQYLKTERVSVGGISYSEAFSMLKSIPLSGQDVDYVCFNTEGKFGYLSFMAGCLDEENGKAGKSWLVVYADGVKIYEELIASNELPKEVVLPINGCSTLRFESVFEEGGDHRVTVFNAIVGKTEADVTGGTGDSGLSELPDVCKLISNIRPYAVASHAEDPLFDGSTQHKTFSMAGRKYNEGVVLYAQANMLFGNSGSHACFNLAGEFQYLTFTAGILDKTPAILDDTLNIYLDGALAQSIELHALDLPKEYTVDLKKCKELKLELVGKDAMIRPAYGVANLVVYRGNVTAHDLFPREENLYPDSMKLLENIRPYLFNFGPSDMGDYDYVYDGSTKQKWFEIDGEQKYEGFLLQTSVHLDLTGEAGQAIMMLGAISLTYIGGVCLLAADVAYESSLAAFDVNGEFSKVTFTVACQDRQEIMGQAQTESLIIGSNEALLEEITVRSDMKPTTYTVDIQNAQQLVFWLQCGSGSSSRYAIYDIIVEK